MFFTKDLLFFRDSFSSHGLVLIKDWPRLVLWKSDSEVEFCTQDTVEEVLFESITHRLRREEAGVGRRRNEAVKQNQSITDPTGS